MLKSIKNMFSRNQTKSVSDYAGFSDFFLNAPADLKKKVITDAAKKANEDQLELFNRANLKARIN